LRLFVFGPKLSHYGLAHIRRADNPLGNSRGQIDFAIAPTRFPSPDNWFRLSVIRQYLEDCDETNFVPPEAEVAWFRDNRGRIGELFNDANAPRSWWDLIA
jgi:hypothetical protein